MELKETNAYKAQDYEQLKSLSRDLTIVRSVSTTLIITKLVCRLVYKFTIYATNYSRLCGEMILERHSESKPKFREWKLSVSNLTPSTKPKTTKIL